MLNSEFFLSKSFKQMKQSFHKRCMTAFKKGQSLVELAIVLPVILVIIGGIFDFGRIFNAYLVISNGAREGARMAITGSTNNEITNIINQNTSTLESSQITITINPSTNRISGQSVSVQIDYDVDLVIPIIDIILPDPFPITSKTVMRME